MAGRHKGGPKTGGRKKGATNKITTALREDILQAAALAGGEGGTIAYLRAQAGANPTAFMSLLGRVLPLQVGGDPNNPVNIRQTIEQHIVDPKG